MTAPIQITNSSADGTMVKDDEPLAITATVHCAVRHRRDCEGVQVNKETLDAAEKEAREFLRRVKVLRSDEYLMRERWIPGGPKSAAVRRQSMELSRMLSILRRPN
jgi:acyl-CoA synthetase (NDP forming)